MKRKKLLKLVISVLVIAILIALPIVITKSSIRNDLGKVVDSWEAANDISTNKFSFHKGAVSDYDITIVWNGFEDLTPSQMRDIIKSWNSDVYRLENIVSNGHKYKVIDYEGAVYSYDRKEWIVPRNNNLSSKASNLDNPTRTATCNYCNGTGKVDGSTCPWCNGSGKTYDNAFNDMLK